jgi:hypothetical protein
MTFSLQHHERLWARIIQESYPEIPDPQEKWQKSFKVKHKHTI